MFVAIVLLNLFFCVFALAILAAGVLTMSAKVDELVDTVSALRGTVASGIVALDGIFALLQAAVDTGDIAKVQAVIDDAKASTSDLAAAIARDTPPAP